MSEIQRGSTVRPEAHELETIDRGPNYYLPPELDVITPTEYKLKAEIEVCIQDGRISLSLAPQYTTDDVSAYGCFLIEEDITATYPAISFLNTWFGKKKADKIWTAHIANQAVPAHIAEIDK